MNNDKYRDVFIAIIKALQLALKQSTWGGLTRLYLVKEYGLENIPIIEIKDILNSLENEGILKIKQPLIISEFLLNDTPTAPLLSDYLGSFPKRIPRNHFILDINIYKFKRLLDLYGSPLFLLSIIPTGKKYKNHKVIVKLLIDKKKVPNENIASKIRIKDGYSRVRLTKEDYRRNKTKYNLKIKYSLKTLRKILLPYGYKIEFNKNYTELIKI
ncbi:hypothetical protein A3G67_01710 [Candidatus Roizmanbacteria bacterium RIFCSPLOWO2_12_FULL_40_12]|uniref:Uncharacterized protein n=1 Tax=Candidatus Roizmanbacteria bacterium RIFCSPLOWO2_01_FULL_40_42 TaxID=1802066 RepID=A0A1F7J1Z2_9BACT|nr:MAG: hypothetical protein A3C31_04220 [Candidatus Roizmanbacteria bacterium RIFCSPHIGHO2_02_FULL_40_53]OGK29726.1 MAG: hypothetical protein A2W49_04680 [Candidatus Roizmanbacteria bacterium RIFCSPHIGHO2_12_41_18]OGK49616.1 MAG: hypothetical protein A3B50_04150 [Candidatus Roizmanbacteria bacterium RIFCSPLOWO2_01_FULL_40_42]OGK61753.1 MAG: hypothetical protein A3G67_01710 [Candidatus Roizmanbacteria bacterium RIFCSPLOWO2_12_FULL_40_12]